VDHSSSWLACFPPSFGGSFFNYGDDTCETIQRVHEALPRVGIHHGPDALRRGRYHHHRLALLLFAEDAEEDGVYYYGACGEFVDVVHSGEWIHYLRHHDSFVDLLADDAHQPRVLGVAFRYRQTLRKLPPHLAQHAQGAARDAVEWERQSWAWMAWSGARAYVGRFHHPVYVYVDEYDDEDV